MNYELAKQLKDAGFPQHSLGMICEHGDVSYGNDQEEHFCSAPKISYPTLEELIEACGGDHFCSLEVVNPTTKDWDESKKYVCRRLSIEGDGRFSIVVRETFAPDLTTSVALFWIWMNQNRG